VNLVRRIPPSAWWLRLYSSWDVQPDEQGPSVPRQATIEPSGISTVWVSTRGTAPSTWPPTTACSTSTSPVNRVASPTAARVAGRLDPGDSFTLTFSEPISPGSIIAGWNGTTPQNVVVRGTGNGNAKDRLTVYNATNTTLLPLGTVNLKRPDYVPQSMTFGATGTPHPHHVRQQPHRHPRHAQCCRTRWMNTTATSPMRTAAVVWSVAMTMATTPAAVALGSWSWCRPNEGVPVRRSSAAVNRKVLG